jgi:excisionase family DNA binding protein
MAYCPCSDYGASSERIGESLQRKMKATGAVLDDQDVFLTREEAAKYLRVSIPTLERWASHGVGPPFHKLGGVRGRVLYPLLGLRAFAGRQAA